MNETIKVISIDDGYAMRLPWMREFIAACYAGPKFDIDPEAFCDYLFTEIDRDKPWVKLFIAMDGDRSPCGMALVTVAVDPLSPNPWLSHLVGDERGASALLIDAVVGYVRERGFSKISIFNQTGATDAAHIRMCRRWAKGTVGGSLIVYDLGA
jgi:hypothetical protein